MRGISARSLHLFSRISKTSHTFSLKSNMTRSQHVFITSRNTRTNQMSKIQKLLEFSVKKLIRTLVFRCLEKFDKSSYYKMIGLLRWPVYKLYFGMGFRYLQNYRNALRRLQVTNPGRYLVTLNVKSYGTFNARVNDKETIFRYSLVMA